MKKILFSLLVLFAVSARAQVSISNPKEKISISATVDGVANTDYTWDTKHGDNIAEGNMTHGMNVKVKSNVNLVSGLAGTISVAPFYNFSTTQLQTTWNGAPMFDIPDEHHNYGVTVSALLNIMLGSKEHGKPISFLATTAPNFSEHGYENMSGVFGTMIHLIRKPDTYLAVGAIYLYGSLSWPLYPLIIYRHDFDNHWSVSMMELNDYLYYKVTPKIKFALGTELVSDKIYFRPKNEQLPQKALYSLLSERVGLYANWQTTKEMSMELSAGANLPIWGRVRESGHRHVYMKLHDDVKPYVQMKVSYSIKK